MEFNNFGEKSDDRQTVFAVSFEDVVSKEKGALSIFNSLKSAKKFVMESIEDDKQYDADISYMISQHDVDS